MITDNFGSAPGGISSPARNAFAVSLSDTVDFTVLPREVFVGTGGDVKGILIDAAGAVTFKNVPSGTRLPYRFKRIYATGTGASDIVGVY